MGWNMHGFPPLLRNQMLEKVGIGSLKQPIDALPK
jgi:hypothetical protein